ncbi:MAG: hypothetical protein L3J71_00915 [Victivallaceae bacterium]|nr:hypothetical protein [Victivallaceae bacterium]
MIKLNKILLLVLLTVGPWVDASNKCIVSNNRYKINLNASSATLSISFAALPDKPYNINLSPYDENHQTVSRVVSCKAVKNNPDTFKIKWQTAGRKNMVIGQLAIAKDKSIQLTPVKNMGGVFINSMIKNIVLPSRSVESVNYLPGNYPPATRINIPPENLLLGLAANGNRLIVIANPQPSNKLSIYRNKFTGAQAGFSRIDYRLNGGSINLAVWDIKNIWHSVDTAAMKTGETVKLNWQPPFTAEWIIELSENNIPIFYYLRSKRKNKYRPIIGMYQWPFWSENNHINLRIDSKMFGEISNPGLIYALDSAPTTPYYFLASLYSNAKNRPIELNRQRDLYSLMPRKLANSLCDNTCHGLTIVSEIFVKTGAFGQHPAAMSRHAENRLGLNTASEKLTRKYLDWNSQMKTNINKWRNQEHKNNDLVKYFNQLDILLSKMDKELKNALNGKTPEKNIAHSLQLSQQIKKLVYNNSGTERAPELYELLRQMNSYMALYERTTYYSGRNLRIIFKAAAKDAAGSVAACRYATIIRAQIRQLLTTRGGYELILPHRKNITK